MYEPVVQTPIPHEAPGRPAVGSVILLMVCCAVEGTLLAFGTRPTISDLVSDLGGFSIHPTLLVVLLGIFLTVIIAGSYACIQVMVDAINKRDIANIVSNFAVQVVVAMVEVFFLYRGLVDAMAPWLAQQGLAFGVAGTLGFASAACVAVRGMTWYLVGTRGARALVPLLGRRKDTPTRLRS